MGKPLSAVSSLHFDTLVRAISWNSVMTMDFNSMDFNLHRLNFLADKSDTITQIYCG